MRAAWAQEMLNFLVISNLLKNSAKHIDEGGAFFWPVLRNVEFFFEGRGRVRLSELPAESLKPVTNNLLFKCHIPSIGEKASLLVPNILGRVAIDAASRVANSKKEGRNKLRVSTVLAGLQREIETRYSLIKGKFL